MDLMQRRAMLEAKPNPDKTLDYIITLEGHLPNSKGSNRQVVLRYVPDREVLDARSFGNYLESLSGDSWENPEDLAVTVISDVNNEVVARWVQVSVRVPELNHHAVETHSVVIEDRQPNWDNRALLSRLGRI
ncbi:hypothetical protein ACFL12_04655 [Pseudomonadota bacterium]